MIILISLMKPSPSGFSFDGEVGPQQADDDAEYQGQDDLAEERAQEPGHGTTPG